MHPHTPATPGMPTEPDPLAQVNVGMRVVDSAGDEVGTVADVYMPGTGPEPETEAGDAERLRRGGHVRVKGSGLFTHDVYVEGPQVAEVAEVDGGMVTLSVPRESLVRAR
jgi:hypothetical protein